MVRPTRRSQKGSDLEPRRVAFPCGLPMATFMMHDKFKKRIRVGHADDRLRRQIATEAARRLMPKISPDPTSPRLIDLSTLEYEAAKRQAVAVLGQRVRPGDLPTDAEVRTEVLRLRSSAPAPAPDPDQEPTEPEPDPGAVAEEPDLSRMADHLDRFAIFKLRLEPLQEIKLDPRWHPEGDALFHSLQVFERARDVRPYDEEFLLAALLHAVGRALDPNDPVPATQIALEGTLTERTNWLIVNLPEVLPKTGRPPGNRIRHELRQSPYCEDLELLGEMDLAGRQCGVHVGTVDEALAYIRALEAETAFSTED